MTLAKHRPNTKPMASSCNAHTPFRWLGGPKSLGYSSWMHCQFMCEPSIASFQAYQALLGPGKRTHLAWDLPGPTMGPVGMARNLPHGRIGGYSLSRHGRALSSCIICSCSPSPLPGPTSTETQNPSHQNPKEGLSFRVHRHNPWCVSQMSSEYLALKAFIHNFQNCDRTTALEVTLAISLAACRGTLQKTEYYPL